MSALLSRRALLGALGCAGVGALLVPDLRALLGGAWHPEWLGEPIAEQVSVLGTRVTLVAIHPDQKLATHAIRQAIRSLFEVHSTMTRHEPSPLVALNRRAGDEPRAVPSLILPVLNRSRELHRATDGLFDATLGRLTRDVERFARQHERLPREGELKHLVEGTGWGMIHSAPTSGMVSFLHPNTELDFDGIAKGFAVDQAAAAMRAQGLEHFLINAGGDLYAAGIPGPEERGWRIHVRAPDGGKPAHTLTVSDRAVATSGNYWRPKLSNGQVLRHLLNPRLASPGGDFASATVVADTAMDADAWSTAAFIGRPAEVELLARRHRNLEALLVDWDGRVAHLAT